METPHAGLDARERGTLVHAVLANAWGELGGKTQLEALDGTALDALLERAASQALAQALRRGDERLAGRFGAIERRRLIGLARDWLDHERRMRSAGPDFQVVAREARHEVEIAGLKLNVRLDRVDETANGARIVIDYKTAEAKLPSILRARLDEPQLPIYLTYCEPTADAGAFAQVRAGAMRFVGLAREGSVLPGVRTPEQAMRQSGARASWPEQRAFWQEELERLARAYAEGRADVDPKNPPLTCRECELQPLCRIAERREDDVEANGKMK